MVTADVDLTPITVAQVLGCVFVFFIFILWTAVLFLYDPLMCKKFKRGMESEIRTLEGGKVDKHPPSTVGGYIAPYTYKKKKLSRMGFGRAKVKKPDYKNDYKKLDVNQLGEY